MNVFESGRLVKGIKDNLVLFGSDEEKSVIGVFAEYFGVTFTRLDRFKGKEYGFCFLSPGQGLKNIFNMSNEVLLLFDRNTSFDTRCFDFVDKTVSEYKNRIDSVCVLIVSYDPSFFEKIKNYTNSQKDSRIIVPFSMSEFNRLKQNYNIEERLREYLFTRNLFAVESPLTSDMYFFGRDEQVHNLYTKYSLGQHSGLFGLRKSGKTSVLYAVQRRLNLESSFSLYLDCQNPGVYQMRWFNLLCLIIKKFGELYEVDSLSSIIEYSESNAASKFELDLKIVKRAIGEKRLLIVFDEIEHITFDTSSESHWKSGKDYLKFWQTIRSVFQTDSSIFAFIIAGVNPSITENPRINGIDNPIFSMFESHYLKLFETDSVRKMLSILGGYMGIRFNEDLVPQLKEDYGGHPFLIRNVCSSLVNKTKYRPFEINKHYYNIRKNEIDRELFPYIESILGVLKEWYPNEFAILNEISAVTGREGYRKAINLHIIHLIGYGIITESEGFLFIAIDAIKEYLKNYDSVIYPATIEDRWKKVSINRNALEMKLRQIVKNVLVTRKGNRNLMEILISIKNDSDKQKMMGLNADRAIQEYYFFKDLQIIIEKYWVDFENIFHDKSKFSSTMELINKQRVDAHAKDIDEENYLFLCLSIKWLDEKVNEFLN